MSKYHELHHQKNLAYNAKMGVSGMEDFRCIPGIWRSVRSRNNGGSWRSVRRNNGCNWRASFFLGLSTAPGNSGIGVCRRLRGWSVLWRGCNVDPMRATVAPKSPRAEMPRHFLATTGPPLHGARPWQQTNLLQARSLSGRAVPPQVQLVQSWGRISPRFAYGTRPGNIMPGLALSM